MAAPPDLRLIVITDHRLAAPRSVLDVVAEALEAGTPAIQLRDKEAPAARLFEEALELRRLTRRHGALLFVNDRIDVALAAGADGAHLGPDDIPVAAAREAVRRATRSSDGFLIGCSADDPVVAHRAATEGADYIGCGAVFGTTSRSGLQGERIGVDRLREVVRAVPVPVVGIGGITPENAAAVAPTGAAGVAVISAVMAARDVGETVRRLLDALPPL